MAERKVTTKVELLRLIDQAADEGWTELDLAGLGLEELPAEIGKLKSLEKLMLNRQWNSGESTVKGNNLSSLPSEINRLTNLNHLDISDNKFSCFPEVITELIELEFLNLGNNSIIESPCSLIKLNKIKTIYWWQSNLNRFPIILTQLVSLKSIVLNVNSITSIPSEIENLSNLIELSLNGNSLLSISDEVCKLKSLEVLILSTNSIGKIPEKIGRIKHLRVFDMSGNKISKIPAGVFQLEKLKEIYLSDNMITQIPREIGQLKSLHSISLARNNISQISSNILHIKDLRSLNLRANKINQIPDSFAQLSHLKKLDLRQNLLPISPEILGTLGALEPGPVKDILNYWRELQGGEKRPLNEAKLLLVGQGSVGKTSLINRLLNDEFDRNESQTDGLAVHDWQIHVNSKDIRLNVWDFGGQEIYHATHQFFLTKRSLYLLVCNCRTSEDENRLEYWLKLIQSFGGSSPVIIVGNKNDEQPLDINQRALREKYPNIKAILQTSCQSGDGIAELKQAIETEVGQLKEVYDLLPLKWFEVKEQLEAMDQDFIKYSQYERLCEDQDIPEDHNQEQLIRLLHDLGLVLNYRDHPILSNTNVLNPDWVTAGIYALFSDDDLKTKTRGILQPPDLSRILDPKRYPPRRHIFLTELLKQFQLGFELPNSSGASRPTEKQFLLPGLLPKEEPSNTNLDGETLEFQYHYKVLPASVLSRFIVLMHEKIHEQTYWRSGVMLAYRDGDETFNLARIKADPEDKKVFISISGRESTRRIFLSLIRDKFAEIHKAFADPEDVTEWVPVPDYPDADPLEYKDLLGLEEMGETNVLIGKLKLRLDLRQLLDGYESREARQYRQSHDGQGINVPVNVQVQVQSDNVGGDKIGRDKMNEQNNN